MRVIHLINSLAVGGAERFVLELFQEWERQEVIDLQLVLLNRSQPEYDFYVPKRTPIVLGFHGSWRNARSVHNAVYELKRIIQTQKRQIIHTHLWLSDFVGALAARATGIIHVSHIHNELDWLVSPRLGFQVRRRIFAWCLRRANTFMIWPAAGPGEYTTDALRLRNSKYELIPYGIDFSRITCRAIAEPNRERVQFGTLGRFVPEKGHLTLLRASRILAERNKRFQVTLGGYGPLESQYRSFVQTNGLQDYVLLHGLVVDVSAFLGSLDVYVQPSSNKECLPITILEAMAAGRPIIATQVAGIPEVVRHRIDGLIVPPNDPVALASAMEELIENAEQRQYFAENAKKRALQHYDIGVAARRIESLYEKLLASTGPRNSQLAFKK